jgi:tetratricopeptide (TPR) repeat protein
VGYWRDGITLFSRAVAVTERNYQAQANLGSALLAAGDLDAARKHSAAAVQINPHFFVARLNLATVLLQQGDLRGAAQNARMALANNPKLAESQVVLAEVARQEGRPREARAWLERALAAKPPLAGRADLQIALGDVAADLGEHDAAVAHYDKAMGIEPDTFSTVACQRIGAARIRQGRIEDAIGAYERAVVIDRTDPRSHALLGDALVAAGRVREAVASYQQGLRLDPESHVVANNLAWILATSKDLAVRDGAQAVVIAERAVNATRMPSYQQLDTLAAALAAAGRFEEAAATAQSALESALANSQDPDAQQIRARLARYRGGMAYYD